MTTLLPSAIAGPSSSTVLTAHSERAAGPPADMDIDKQSDPQFQISQDEILARHLQRIENALMPLYANQVPIKRYQKPAEPKKETPKLPPYRSLIKDESLAPPASKKLGKLISMSSIKQRIIDATTSSSDNYSIKSKRSCEPVMTFDKLPMEIKCLIMKQLENDQRTLYECLFVNKNLYWASLRSLYKHPKIHTSYRLGQFVTTIIQNDQLAPLVKVLDLSKLDYPIQLSDEEKVKFQNHLIFGNINVVENLLGGERPILAGWKDWKYRNHPFYSMGRRRNSFAGFPRNKLALPEASRTRSNNSVVQSLNLTEHENKVKNYFKRVLHRKKKKRVTLAVSHSENAHDVDSSSEQAHLAQQKPQSAWFNHPIQNYFLRGESFNKDIPIGYILHLLNECTQLEVLDLSYIQLSKDFEITHGDEEGLYWSDSVLELDCFNSEELRLVTINDIWTKLVQLGDLRVLRINGIPSIELNHLEMVIYRSQFRKNLQEVHCCNSGMIRRPEFDQMVSIKQWRRFFRQRRKRGLPGFEG